MIHQNKTLLLVDCYNLHLSEEEKNVMMNSQFLKRSKNGIVSDIVGEFLDLKSHVFK